MTHASLAFPSVRSLALSPETGLARYLQDIQKFPMLSKQEEQRLAHRWVEQKDVAAAHTLVTSHLRLVAKLAFGYRGYGLPVADLIAEGNIGLMTAVKKFDPRRGFRLSTYAMWWIKAHMQEFILRSWSLVKIGTTAAQKKLFFNLRRIKGRMNAYDRGDLSPADVTRIARELDVPEYEVTDMNRRLAGADYSLNAPMGNDGDDTTQEWQDVLVDDRANAETLAVDADQHEKRHAVLAQALTHLKDRERDILVKRRLHDPAMTLEELSLEHGISRERVRQIENRAFEKIQAHLTAPAEHPVLAHG